MGHSWEILRCLAADRGALRARLAAAAAAGLNFEERREQCKVLLPFITAQLRVEEETLLCRALEIENCRVSAMAALEEHELIGVMVDRANHSAHGEQLEARLRVLLDLVDAHTMRGEKNLVQPFRLQLSVAEREEMGMRYRQVKDRNELTPIFQLPIRESVFQGQSGRLGYVIAWLLGVPVWLLLLVFVIRGH